MALFDFTLALGAIKTEWYALSSLRVNYYVLMDEPRLYAPALSQLVYSFGTIDVLQLLQKV